MKKILVVDDDQSIRRSLELHLTEEGYEVVQASDGIEGANAALNKDVDLVLLDLRLPGADGFDVLKKLKQFRPTLPIVVITAYDDMKTAIEAVRLGAFDHLGKPLDLAQLDDTLTSAFSIQALSEKGFQFSPSGEGEFRPDIMVGNSKAIKGVFKAIGAVADSRATILLEGESGTGKELVARAIHVSGRYAQSPFVPVVCSALTPTLLESELFGHEKGAFTGAYQRKSGKFEQAQGGTLFLDEIAEITPETQVKLLRFLQEKEFQRVGGSETLRSEVRVVAATNRDLSAMVGKGLFREDLFFRLKVVTIRIPPLRERKEDIPLLVQYFLEKICREADKPLPAVPTWAMEMLMNHSWPGNVRELENTIRRAVLMSPENVLLPETLELTRTPSPARLPLILKPIHTIEKEHIENVLAYTGFEKKRAAEILDISRPTLDKRIRDYDIRIPGE